MRGLPREMLVACVVAVIAKCARACARAEMIE